MGDVLAAGEGIETVLSLRTVMPTLPMVAALSSANLAALILPTGLQRLYIAEDNDTAGRRATADLATRAAALGIDAIVLTATLGDFNDDLRQFGHECFRVSIRLQIAPEDVERFLAWSGNAPPGSNPFMCNGNCTAGHESHFED